MTVNGSSGRLGFPASVRLGARRFWHSTVLARSGSDTTMEIDGRLTHVPVMLETVLSYLQRRSGGLYVDATLGGGGHAEAILRRSAPRGRLLGLDRDADAVERVRAKLEKEAGRVHLAQGSFADLKDHLDAIEWPHVDGILADLGLSSMQLSDPERGFSFAREGPLDMRFDRSSGATAAELVNQLDERRLAEILREYGEERRARSIARSIVRARPVGTTAELRQVIARASGARRGRIDPATRSFQALRIVVNAELASLDRLLEQAPERLAPGGRLIVISYHSLEDRAVKWAFRGWANKLREVVEPPTLAKADAVGASLGAEYRIVTPKPIVASGEERQENPRARSAKLRVLERIR